MRRRFEDKAVVVTGGASGIGAATARLFAEEGARVLVCDRNEAGGRALVDTLGPGAVFHGCNVADRLEVEAMIAAAIAAFARIDVLFNNAGISGPIAATPDVTPEQWDRVVAVNLNAIFYACRAAVPHMRAQGGGAIVNTASVSGLFGDYGLNVYSATKGAVVNYTRTLALDHARENIRVNALCPGFIETALSGKVKRLDGIVEDWLRRIPMGRAGSPREMAQVVAFLASDDASYVTGAMLTADGGITAATGQPNLLWFAENA